MKKLLFFAFALLASSFSVFAELQVEITDDGRLHVWGCAAVSEYFNVFTNSVGSCTNCIQISPEQMHAYKTSIISHCDSVDENLDVTIMYASNIINRMNYDIQNISTFRRFGRQPSANPTVSEREAFTNYLYSVDNAQTALCRQFPISRITPLVAYNNGIYDYANEYVYQELSTSKEYAEYIVNTANYAKFNLSSIESTVRSMSEEACQGCASGSGGGDTGDGGGDSSSCGDCPCAEQLDAIKDYVEHIDDDFHDQLFQISVVTNYVQRMDSYARLVSGILYNDATIVVDSGENSWSNVYRRGYSDLYDYDKSNILQRIELLLFGLTPISTTTNWGEVADIESDSVNVQEQINGVGDTISEGHDGLAENVTTIRGKILTLFRALNFFGSSNMSTFTINDPFQVFDVYEVEGVEPNDIDGLESFRNLIRSCFQVIYWVSGIAFMIAFWYFVVSFVVRRVFGFLKFFNNLLT